MKLATKPTQVEGAETLANQKRQYSDHLMSPTVPIGWSTQHGCGVLVAKYAARLLCSLL